MREIREKFSCGSSMSISNQKKDPGRGRNIECIFKKNEALLYLCLEQQIELHSLRKQMTETTRGRSGTKVK